MIQGVLLGFLAYGLLASGDGVIKSLGPDRFSIFEIGFWFCVFALCATYFMRPKTERWRDILRMRHPVLVLLRCFSGISAGLLGVYAFLTIPFAEAYALIFMAPFVVLFLSIVVLKEKVGWRGFLAMALGLAGVLLVIRPGIRAVEWGHLTALGTAICAGCTVIILRKISGDEKRTVLLGMPQLLSLVFNGGVAAATGFVMPGLIEFASFAAAGLLGALGQLALLAATRRAPASAVGQTQYSQLIWAVLIGAVAFAEYPDPVAVIGLLVIGLAGLLTIAEQRARKAPASLPAR